MRSACQASLTTGDLDIVAISSMLHRKIRDSVAVVADSVESANTDDLGKWCRSLMSNIAPLRNVKGTFFSRAYQSHCTTPSSMMKKYPSVFIFVPSLNSTRVKYLDTYCSNSSLDIPL
eukprot:CAMPEP_0178614182 /NCGR_PEP_ID=MMETSP0698-20121128/2031_1 /TAXON_ID=265572 /ORGANISM="Extubocellulus spinifer, Strain CCMP396" /LENGTH=117 /DNA_ID=CAMNT_0020252907 /DNA_START=894 /DNA_END=1247 /DNA_ORIENTATION=+